MAKAISTRRRMSEKDEACVQKCLLEIERSVQAHLIVTHLFAAKVLTFDETNEITNAETRQQRIRLLIDKLILHGGPNGFVEFIKSLKKNYYCDLAKSLEGCKHYQIDNKSGHDVQNCKLDNPQKSVSELKRKIAKREDLQKDSSAINKNLGEIKRLEKDSETKRTLKKTAKLEAERKMSNFEKKIRDLKEEREKNKVSIISLKKRIVRQTFTITELKKESNDRGKELEKLKKNVEVIECRLKRLEDVVLKRGRKPKRTPRNIVQ